MESTEKKLYEIAEIHKGRIIPMSLGGLYKACAEGKIPTVTIGKRMFVPSWYLDKLLNEPSAEKGGINS